MYFHRLKLWKVGKELHLQLENRVLVHHLVCLSAVREIVFFQTLSMEISLGEVEHILIVSLLEGIIESFTNFT